MNHFSIRQLEAALACERFQLLVAEEKLSLNQTAWSLGKSPSWFSGGNSILAKYRRGGPGALFLKSVKSKK